MQKVLGIDTSNYTTSIAVVDENGIIYDKRKILDVKRGEKGLRQSEALFQHVNNLPDILDEININDIAAVCVSVKPRPQDNSYMPVFIAGERFAKVISISKSIPLFLTTHQEGHIESALQSISFNYNDFIALHLSGGTSEVLMVKKYLDYKIELIGGTRDISFGQFIDRLGVELGINFPCGRTMDDLALSAPKKDLRIPSRVDGYYFNLSGQETNGLNMIKNGYNQEEISFAAMMCVAKTLEKLINNLINDFNLPIILIGGVSSSNFLKKYFKGKFEGRLFFSESNYATDNAVGVAYIGLRKIKEE
ncbi:tRNA N6-adenosine threonylcarbamoyltransferase [Caloramator mitchellensis]|uniref:N(6)-L-threonylcarbamoyladenine synthase n=1 Tax=Caloramator mitchellensis TaxID=908809 RepID=A0A0R3K3D3_CALMK|nr:hypothetical protein [Caloramator mitchellensis]KRQ86831.1 tRNA N6-adenosine threonylcarbamoyltransferase [Caloramator mitchellensis]